MNDRSWDREYRRDLRRGGLLEGVKGIGPMRQEGDVYCRPIVMPDLVWFCRKEGFLFPGLDIGVKNFGWKRCLRLNGSLFRNSSTALPQPAMKNQHRSWETWLWFEDESTRSNFNWASQGWSKEGQISKMPKDSFVPVSNMVIREEKILVICKWLTIFRTSTTGLGVWWRQFSLATIRGSLFPNNWRSRCRHNQCPPLVSRYSLSKGFSQWNFRSHFTPNNEFSQFRGKVCMNFCLVERCRKEFPAFWLINIGHIQLVSGATSKLRRFWTNCVCDLPSKNWYRKQGLEQRVSFESSRLSIQSHHEWTISTQEQLILVKMLISLATHFLDTRYNRNPNESLLRDFLNLASNPAQALRRFICRRAWVGSLSGPLANLEIELADIFDSTRGPSRTKIISSSLKPSHCTPPPLPTDRLTSFESAHAVCFFFLDPV